MAQGSGVHEISEKHGSAAEYGAYSDAPESYIFIDAPERG